MTDQSEIIEERAELVRALGRATSRASRHVRLFTGVLNANPYDDPVWLAELRRLALRGSRCKVQLLAREVGEDVHRAHDLARLVQRLSSAMEVRLAHPRDRERNERLLLIDDSGVLRQVSEETVRAFYWPDDRSRNRTLREEFEQLWGRAEPHPAFRRLLI